MDKKELGGMLKGKLQETANTVKNTVKDVKIPEMKKPDIKVPDQIKNVFKKNDSTEDQVVSTELSEEEKKELQEAEEKAAAEKKEAELSQSEIQTVKVVSPLNAVKVFYYLMAADGDVKSTEEEKFTLVGNELDPEFEEHKDYIIKSCKEQLDKVIDKDDYYDVIQDGVEEALLAQQVFDKGYVPAKLLVWNLLTIAYSDESYDDVERKLMKYIVRKVDIPKDVFLEMENTYLAVKDIEKEMDWIKGTDRPYRVIETTVKELERREQAILESVKALIYL